MAVLNLSDGNTVLIAMSEAIGDLSGVWVGWIRNRYLPSTSLAESSVFSFQKHLGPDKGVSF